MAKQIDSTITSDQTVRLTIKEFISIAIFLISLGITIGGYINSMKEIEKLTTNVSDVKDNIEKSREGINALNLESGKIQEKLLHIEKEADRAYNQCITCDKNAGKLK